MASWAPDVLDRPLAPSSTPNARQRPVEHVPAWKAGYLYPQPPGDARTQKALGIYWCHDCAEWTLASSHGRCMFCDLRIAPAAFHNRLANAAQQQRHRDRR